MSAGLGDWYPAKPIPMLRQGGKSTSFVSGNRKTVHTTFNDGSELVEEYDVKTDELLGEERERP